MMNAPLQSALSESERRSKPLDNPTAEYFDGRAADWSEHYRADPRFERRYLLIKRLIEANVFSKQNPGAALDVGCGSGVFTKLIASYGWTAVGIDLSHEMIEQAQKRTSHQDKAKQKLSFREGTVENLRDEPMQYDLVVSFSMLEYVERDAEALTILSALVKPGGTLVLTVPNRSGLIRKLERIANALRKLSGERFLRGRGEYLAIQKHQYSASELDAMITALGLVRKSGKYLNAAFSAPEWILELFERKWWAAMYLGIYQK